MQTVNVLFSAKAFHFLGLKVALLIFEYLSVVVKHFSIYLLYKSIYISICKMKSEATGSNQRIN